MTTRVVSRACIIIGALTNEFDEIVCYQLFGKDSMRIWQDYESACGRSIARFISRMNTTDQDIFLNWAQGMVNLDMVNEAIDDGKMPQFAIPKTHFISPVVKVKLQQEAREKMGFNVEPEPTRDPSKYDITAEKILSMYKTPEPPKPVKREVPNKVLGPSIKRIITRNMRRQIRI
jgi:hypothetical protein